MFTVYSETILYSFSGIGFGKEMPICVISGYRRDVNEIMRSFGTARLSGNVGKILPFHAA